MIVTLLTVLALAAPAEPAAAKPDADTLLRRADDAGRRADDASFTLDVQIRHRDGSMVSRKLAVWQRGATERMVKFLAPARLRGTGVLRREDDRVLVYLPAYGRVREVTGREGGEAFLGSGFSLDELSLKRLAPDHHATLRSEDENSWTLRATPKAAEAHDYAALRIRVRKKDDITESVAYLDGEDHVYRRLVMSDFRDEGGHVVAHHIVLTDERDGKKTTAELDEIKFDTGLGSARFTERALRRRP